MIHDLHFQWESKTGAVLNRNSERIPVACCGVGERIINGQRSLRSLRSTAVGQNIPCSFLEGSSISWERPIATSRETRGARYPRHPFGCLGSHVGRIIVWSEGLPGECCLHRIYQPVNPRGYSVVTSFQILRFREKGKAVLLNANG